MLYPVDTEGQNQLLNDQLDDRFASFYFEQCLQLNSLWVIFCPFSFVSVFPDARDPTGFL